MIDRSSDAGDSDRSTSASVVTTELATSLAGLSLGPVPQVQGLDVIAVQDDPGRDERRRRPWARPTPTGSRTTRRQS